MNGKVFITGAFGRVGTTLLDLPVEKVLFDKKVPGDFSSKSKVVQGDIQDKQLLEESMRGCGAVVHLAACASVASPWQDVLENNIIAMQTVLEAAKNAKVNKVIFASSNHVVGMVELENVPRIYSPGHGITLTKDEAPRPDSYYGVSKAFGETLGCFFAENGGPRFYAIRIGSVHAAWEDHPYAEAEGLVRMGRCQRGDDLYKLKVKRQKAIWLSRRDQTQLIRLCLAYEGPVFDIFYGVSENATRWLDIEYAKDQLGYQPQDRAEEWTAAPETEMAK